MLLAACSYLPCKLGVRSPYVRRVSKVKHFGKAIGLFSKQHMQDSTQLCGSVLMTSDAVVNATGKCLPAGFAHDWCVATAARVVACAVRDILDVVEAQTSEADAWQVRNRHLWRCIAMLSRCVLQRQQQQEKQTAAAAAGAAPAGVTGAGAALCYMSVCVCIS